MLEKTTVKFSGRHRQHSQAALGVAVPFVAVGCLGRKLFKTRMNFVFTIAPPNSNTKRHIQQSDHNGYEGIGIQFMKFGTCQKQQLGQLPIAGKHLTAFVED